MLDAQFSETITINDESGNKREVFTGSPATYIADAKIIRDAESGVAVGDIESESIKDLQTQLTAKREKRALRHGEPAQLASTFGKAEQEPALPILVQSGRDPAELSLLNPFDPMAGR